MQQPWLISKLMNKNLCIKLEINQGYTMMHGQTIIKNRCKNFSSLLLDFYVQLNMFRASSRPSSGA
jgi:hypothetical protein